MISPLGLPLMFLTSQTEVRKRQCVVDDGFPTPLKFFSKDSIFRMAGTRNLPIVFIDDKYTGDFDTCAALEESGELDKRLNYRKKK